MKILSAGLFAVAVALSLPACGGDEYADEAPPAVSQDDAATPLPPLRDDDADGVPNSGGFHSPCEHAMCNDLDQREWVSNPPPDERPGDVSAPVADPYGRPLPANIRINVRVNVRAAGR